MSAPPPPAKPTSAPSGATLPPGFTPDQLKARAGEKASWLKDEYGRVRSAFDRQTRWWKYRFWIVAGYAAIAVASVLLWAPPLDTLGAQVHVQADFNNRPKVIILNTSGAAWNNVVVRIEGDAGRATEAQRTSVEANEDWSLPALDFRPTKIRISAREGSTRVVLQEP